MKSSALQAFIKNVFSDENTKKEFLSAPEKVISQYKLTEQEKRAVLSTHAKLGLMTGNSQQLEIGVEPFTTWI